MSADLQDRRVPPHALIRLPTWVTLSVAGVVCLLVVVGMASTSPRPQAPAAQAPSETPAQPLPRVAYPVPLAQAPEPLTLPAPVPPPRPVAAASGDPPQDDRRRRDADSLFADVIVARRPETPQAAQAPQPPPAGAPVTKAQPVGGITIPEGTILEAVLTNRLESSSSEAPVNAMITIDAYVGTTRVIPRGSRALGVATRVQDQGSDRLAVAFHRLMLTDGRSVNLDTLPGLDQQGALGLKDKVNRHYASTFGAAAAVGVLAGLGQLVGGGYRRNEGGTVVVAGTTDAVTQAAMQTMNHFLNRVPTITVREGNRMRIYLTSDVVIPGA